MPIYRINDKTNVNEGGVAAVSIAALIGITHAAIMAAFIYGVTKAFKMEKRNREKVDYVLIHYPEIHKDVINFKELDHKNYSIKPFTKAEKDEEIEDIRQFGGLSFKDHVSVYTYKDKPFMACAYTTDSGYNYTETKVYCEFYSEIAKKHKEYYMSCFCKKRNVYLKNVVKWANSEYEKIKNNKENLNEQTHLNKNTKWTVKPLVSVGKIKFGMKREDVHKLFSEKHTEFKKTKSSKKMTDNYGNFHVYYDSDDKVEAVEIFEGIKVVLNGKTIFPINTKDIESSIPGIKSNRNNFIDKEKSIAIKTNSYSAECITIGCKGYF